MSGVVANVARLKPELRLAEAISQFEASLSSNEKATFRTQRTKSLQSPPDVNDVMRLTAQIDRSRKPGGRCFGPRFTKFLHGVQQFAALGDVVVGGSQNIIACGVWSVVRMSLLAIINCSSYLESLSLLLMEAGRSYPQHLELATLYPRSKALQSHLTEYFVVVVQICHRLQSYTRSSSFRKITSSLNDTDIKEFQSKLVSWSNLISEEIMFLIAKRTEDEAQNNSAFRTLVAKASKATSHQKRLSDLQIVSNLCSDYDYETPWKQIRKIGNTNVFSLLPEYNTWKKRTAIRTLIFTGKMGSGKSVMLANVIDDLVIYCESRSASIAYFFCRHDLPESLKARTIIGALVRQSIRPFINNLKDEKFHQRSSLDHEDMFELIRLVFPQVYTIFIVLDGLHLCDRSEQKTVAKLLKRMQEYVWTQSCVSFRLEPDVESVFESFHHATVVPPLDNTSDIDAFIQEKLESCLEQRTLVLGDPQLILDIHEALSKGSKGMFLWAALQIKALCAMQTDEEIKNALSDLPDDLSAIYEKILQKCPSTGKHHQKRIFQLTTAAQRPLTTEELREALSVRPGDTIWAAAKLVNNIYSTMTSCGCLLTVDEEERTVRFVHPSVEQFLFSTYKDPEGFGTTIEECHKSMADILITYLSYGVFGTEISTTRVPEINVGSAPAKIIESTVRSSKGAQNLALKLLRLRKRPSFDAGNILAKELNSYRGAERQEFYLYEYARKSYLTHLVHVREMSPDIKRLFPNLLQRGDGPGSPLPSSSMAYTKALESDNTAMMRMALLSSNTLGQNDFVPDLMTNEGTYYTRLGIAICTNSEKVVDIHRRAIGNPPMSYERALETSFCEIAFRGSVDLVKRVLESPRAEYWLRHICECGRRPLACAIWGANNDVLELLIHTGKMDINAGPFKRSAVWEAVVRQNLNALYQLLITRSVYLGENEKFELLELAEETGNGEVQNRVQDYCSFGLWVEEPEISAAT